MTDFEGASGAMGSTIVGQLLDTSVPEVIVLDNLVQVKRATGGLSSGSRSCPTHAGWVGQPG